MVLDPDMLLQLAKRSAETSSAAGGSRGGRARQAPHSTVDAWKSINGRPFARWTDPTVDVWDARFEGEGPSNAEWLALPPLEAELDRAAGMMEVRDLPRGDVIGTPYSSRTVVAFSMSMSYVPSEPYLIVTLW